MSKDMHITLEEKIQIGNIKTDTKVQENVN
jgi:hypothetical protein